MGVIGQKTKRAVIIVFEIDRDRDRCRCVSECERNKRPKDQGFSPQPQTTPIKIQIQPSQPTKRVKAKRPLSENMTRMIGFVKMMNGFALDVLVIVRSRPEERRIAKPSTRGDVACLRGCTDRTEADSSQEPPWG